MSYRNAYKNLPKCIDCGIELSKKGYLRCNNCNKKYKKQNKKRIELKCLYCGKIFLVVPYKHDKRKHCSRECLIKSRDYFGKNNPNYGNGAKILGEKNPNWKGGCSSFHYPASFCKELKALIRSRDEYICQHCGKTEKENSRKLNIHHIDYNKNNLKPSNLISLCDSCHSKSNFKCEYWKKILKKRIKNPKNLYLIDIFHIMKNIAMAMNKLKLACINKNEEKRLVICDYMIEICDNLYNDLKDMHGGIPIIRDDFVEPKEYDGSKKLGD